MTPGQFLYLRIMAIPTFVMAMLVSPILGILVVALIASVIVR